MTLRPSATAAALAALQAGLCPPGALAAERACPGMTIEADAGFRGQWPDLLQRIEREVPTRPDVDACARVDLRAAGDATILVSVTLPDGRAASRSLTQRDDVLPTLQALLLVPDLAPPAAAAASSPTPAAAPSPPLAGAPPALAASQRKAFSDASSRVERDEPPASTAGRSLGVELSLFTGARVGDGQLGLGAGAISFVELNDWLIGFEGRADSYRALRGDSRKTALELALLAGRRFDLRLVALDVSAGLAVAMMGFDESHSKAERRSATPTGTIVELPPPVQPPAVRSGPVPRLLLGARWGFNPRSVLGTFVGIDAELGPALASSEPDSARLPTYSLGLSLGASLGTP